MQTAPELRKYDRPAGSCETPAFVVRASWQLATTDAGRLYPIFALSCHRCYNPAMSNAILAGVGVAFAAFYVWLGVRIVNRRERWAKRTALGLLLSPVLYVLSFGPVCWWLAADANVGGVYYPRTMIAYWPIGWTYLRSRYRGPIHSAIGWYATRRNDIVLVPTEPDGTFVTICRPR